MDYFAQGRPQVPAPQGNHHYMNFSQTTPTSYSMNYGQQMQPQQQTSPYQQQHYTVPAGPANSGLDFGSPHGQTMNSHSHSNSRPRTVRSGMMNSGDSAQHTLATASAPRYQLPGQDFPVRILVDHKYIGAIIGNKGVHIKEIINETKARITVDPQKVPKDTQGNADKIINITGPLDNAGRAVVKILEIVEAEMKKEEGDDHKEVELRIRAHNQLVGRLIGRLGCSIKKIMQDTGTVIVVSNTGDGNSGLNSGVDIINNFPQALVTLERTITVRGPSIESVSAAEQKISAKLRQSFEMDLTNRVLQLHITAGVSGMPFMSPMGNEQWMMQASRPPVNSNAQVPKIIKLYVPNNMVGAIIGSKGLHIRNIIRNSGALIRIEGGERKDRSDEEHKSDITTSQEFAGTTPIRSEIEEGQGDGPVASHNGDRRDDERLVTITGNDFQQCRAQYMIYTRIAEQQQAYLDDVKLRTEVVVPSRLVGRIIGKGGQNVKELQRITGTTVKIPEDEPKVETLDENCREGVEGTIVRIIGNYQGSSSVQYRISQLINEFSRTTIHDRRREDNNDSGVSDSLSHNKPTSPSSSAAE